MERVWRMSARVERVGICILGKTEGDGGWCGSKGICEQLRESSFLRLAQGGSL